MMLKLDVIVIAIAISWFLCSDRLETNEQDIDGEALIAASDTVTETADAPEEHGTLRGWLKLGSLVALAAIVLKVF